MARININVATNAHGPSKQQVIGMYVIEHIDDKGKLETKEGMLIREKVTGTELTLMLLINALYIVRKILEIAPVQQFESLTIYTDEQLVETAMLNRWIDKWEENSWKNAKGKEVAHSDLWKRAIELMRTCCERYIFMGQYEFDTSEIIRRDSSFLNWLDVQIDKKRKELEEQKKIDSLIEDFKERM